MQTPNKYRPKVMHIVADVLPGGAEVMMLGLLRQQYANNSCENVMVTLDSQGEEDSLRPELEKVATFYSLECTSFFSSDFWTKFQELLRKEKPDVIHAWSYDSGLVAGFIARFTHGIKVVWAIHSLDLPSRHEYTALRFLILKTMVGIGSRIIPHRVISCSDVATDSHVRFGYPRKRCVTIGNGIDTDLFCPDDKIAANFRKELDVSMDTPLVGYIGRSHPVKRLEDFFAASEILMDRSADVHFVAIGFDVDSLYPAAREAYDRLPDPSRMRLMGRRSDLAQCIPALTINTLCSQSEAMPMVLMEALCCGVPCVTTDVGSSCEIVGEVGECVPASDPGALAESIGRLLGKVLGDPTRWSESARAHGVGRFGIGTTEKLHTEVYCELAGLQPRVLHLVNDLDFGGAQTILNRLACGLNAKGYHQTVISVLPTGRLAPGFTEAGISVESLGVKGLFSGVRGVFRMARMIRKEKPDLVQTWMFHSALIGELAALLSLRSPKVLWSIHHTKLGKESSKLTTRIVQRVLAFLSSRRPERIIYCSQSSVDLHIEDGFDNAKTELIFNGTDTSFYRANESAKAEIRNEYNIPMDAPLIGMAGRYHPQKDFANLLRAFALVQKFMPSAHLIACGPDVTRDTESLCELADLCPEPSQVHLIGPRLDMQRVFPAFSLAALSSCEGEAFPLVLGEAMSCEVPCVATDVGDSALIIGETGRIVSPRDSRALAAAMIDMLGLDDRSMGQKARQRIVDHFTLEQYVQTHATLYEELMGATRVSDESEVVNPVRNNPQAVSHSH